MSSRSPKSVEDTIDSLLNNPLSLPQVVERTEYRRSHDDRDGKRGQELIVCCIGDIFVKTYTENQNSALRFRNRGGGGESLRVYNALKILAYAIKCDNEEFPQYYDDDA